LNGNAAALHLPELASVVPSTHSFLDGHQLLGEDAVPLLLEERILSVFQKDFGFAQLEVGSTKDSLADGQGGLLAVLHMRGLDATAQDAVSLHKVSKRMSDGVSRSSDSDGLHHARVSQLAGAELAIKFLGR
jgi:hypothetical protein